MGYCYLNIVENRKSKTYHFHCTSLTLPSTIKSKPQYLKLHAFELNNLAVLIVINHLRLNNNFKWAITAAQMENFLIWLNVNSVKKLKCWNGQVTSVWNSPFEIDRWRESERKRKSEKKNDRKRTSDIDDVVNFETTTTKSSQSQHYQRQLSTNIKMSRKFYCMHYLRQPESMWRIKKLKSHAYYHFIVSLLYLTWYARNFSTMPKKRPKIPWIIIMALAFYLGCIESFAKKKPSTYECIT